MPESDEWFCPDCSDNTHPCSFCGDTASEGKAIGVGGYRHWEHKEPFELARERTWRLEAKLRTAGRPLTKRRPATRA